MEGERGYNPDYSRDSATEFYRQVTEYLSEEILDNPDTRVEMELLQEKMWLLQQIVPYNVTPYAQNETAYAVQQALGAAVLPHAPVTLPPPGRVIGVGKHMTITKAKARESWPDESKDGLELRDGTTITPQTSMGRIDIVRNLPQLDTEAPLMTFTRQLISSSVGSFRELASLCENNDPRLAQVQAIAGTSHLARMGNRFGFTTFQIENPYDRRRATEVSLSVALRVSGNNQAWQELQANYKPAEIAYISRPELINLYGSQGPQNRYNLGIE